MGTTFDVFHEDGKVPELIECLASIVIGIARPSAQFFNMLFPIPSGPHALPVFRLVKYFIISSGFIATVFKVGEFVSSAVSNWE